MTIRRPFMGWGGPRPQQLPHTAQGWEQLSGYPATLIHPWWGPASGSIIPSVGSIEFDETGTLTRQSSPAALEWGGAAGRIHGEPLGIAVADGATDHLDADGNFADFDGTQPWYWLTIWEIDSTSSLHYLCGTRSGTTGWFVLINNSGVMQGVVRDGSNKALGPSTSVDHRGQAFALLIGYDDTVGGANGTVYWRTSLGESDERTDIAASANAVNPRIFGYDAAQDPPACRVLYSAYGEGDALDGWDPDDMMNNVNRYGLLG